MTEPRIKTTVVGSYPFPGLARRAAVRAGGDRRDARRHPHAGAGRHRSRLRRRALPLRCESSRDQRHDRVFRQADGRRPHRQSRSTNWSPIASSPATKFRTRPPAVVEGPIGAGTLDLPQACARAKRLTRPAVQVHADRPAHAGEDAVRRPLQEPARAHDGDCRRARRAGAASRRRRHAGRRGEPAGQPGRMGMGGRGDEPRARRREDKPAVHLCFGNYGGQSIQKGTWAKLIGYLNALHVDHIVMETAHRPAEELAVFRDLRPEIGFGLGVVDIKSTEIETADQIARAIERAERCSAPIASNTSIRTAVSGCSSATSRTEKSARWCRAATCITDARAERSLSDRTPPEIGVERNSRAACPLESRVGFRSPRESVRGIL